MLSSPGAVDVTLEWCPHYGDGVLLRSMSYIIVTRLVTPADLTRVVVNERAQEASSLQW